MGTAVFALFAVAIAGLPIVLGATLCLFALRGSRPLAIAMLRYGLWLALAGAAIHLAVLSATGSSFLPQLLIVPTALGFVIGSVGGPVVHWLWTRYVRSRTATLAAIAIVACTAALAFVPFSTTLAPAIQLSLADSTGASIVDGCAMESWAHYSLDANQVEKRHTDGRGMVAFPARTISASVARRVAQPLTFVALGIPPVHASFGPESYVSVWSRGLEGSVRPLRAGATRVVMKPAWQPPANPATDICGPM